jgi:hypothetical protein
VGVEAGGVLDEAGMARAVDLVTASAAFSSAELDELRGSLVLRRSCDFSAHRDAAAARCIDTARPPCRMGHLQVS